jgi:hypothetical protein
MVSVLNNPIWVDYPLPGDCIDSQADTSIGCFRKKAGLIPAFSKAGYSPYLFTFTLLTPPIYSNSNKYTKDDAAC